jgi:hypothetical protein
MANSVPRPTTRTISQAFTDTLNGIVTYSLSTAFLVISFVAMNSRNS